MELTKLILLAIKLSIILSVFAIGLRVTWEHVTFLLKRPIMLLKSLLAMNLIMPIVAVVLASLFNLHPALKIALVLLSVSPVPPGLPKKQLKLGGHDHYVWGLLVAAALLSIVLVPLAVSILASVFGVDASISSGEIAAVVGTVLLGPLLVGFIVARLIPSVAKAEPYISKIAGIVLLVCVLLILIGLSRAILSLIDATLLVIVAFVVIGLVVGYLLGGPDSDDRTTLALACAARHPGVALAIAGTNFTNQKLVAPAVVLYLLVNAIVTIPFAMWRKRQLMGVVAPTKEDSTHQV